MQAPNGSTLKVVIADDSALIRERLRALLEEDDCVEVIGLVANGSDLFGFLARGCPDVLLLDLIMPGLTGLELLPAVRRQCRTCLIIVLTSYSTDEFRNRCYQAGADYFLDKATEFDRIPAILRKRHSRGSGSAPVHAAPPGPGTPS